MRDWMVERIIDDEEKGKKETRTTCKAALGEVSKSYYNSPIVLEKMTFNVFFHYIPTKKSKKYRGTSLLPTLVGS